MGNIVPQEFQCYATIGKRKKMQNSINTMNTDNKLFNNTPSDMYRKPKHCCIVEVIA